MGWRTTPWTWLGAVAVLSTWAAWPVARGQGAAAAPVRGVTHRGMRFAVVEIDIRAHPVQLFAERGGVTMASLEERLRHDGATPWFAMNAGMYADTDTFSALGLAISDGRTLEKVNRRRGGGNFFMKPNGVFFLDGKGARVLTTRMFGEQAGADVVTATQSGPMLLIPAGGGPRIHPRFAADSENRHVRNGVGVRGADTAVFAISRDEVTLHELATLFRDELRCEAALYLDGTVSALKAGAFEEGGVGRRWGGLLYAR